MPVATPHPSPGAPMRIAVDRRRASRGSARRTRSRASTTSRSSSATPARAATPTRSPCRGPGGGELRPRHRLPRPQRAQLPAAHAASSASSACAVQDSDMSFAVSCARSRARVLGGAPLVAAAGPGATRPCSACCARSIRFLRTGQTALEERHAREHARRLRRRTRATRGASATSTWCRSRRPSGRPPRRETLAFPVSYAVRFFQNHGLLGFRRHQWRTVTGGSRSLRRRRSPRRSASACAWAPPVRAVAPRRRRRRRAHRRRRRPPLRRGGRRLPRPPGAGDARRRRRRASARCSAPSAPRSTAPCCTPT